MVSRRDQIAGVSDPTGPYSLISRVPPDHGLAWIAGQTGRGSDGSMPGTAYRQTLGALQAIEAIVEDLGALPSDIVAFRTYLVDRYDLPGFAQGREAIFSRWFPDSSPPTNTLAFVTGLADPRARVEIEAVVATPPGTLP